MYSAYVLGLGPILALVFAFVLPYLSAIRGGFGPSFFQTLGSPSLLHIVLFTLSQALASTLGALVLGLPGAWLLSHSRKRGARYLRAISSIPFAMPPILVVLGFILFFGNSGWANRLLMSLSGAEEGPLQILYKPSALVLAHAFYNFPLVLILAGDGLQRSRAAYTDVAASLGASPLKTFWTVSLPLAFPSILASASLVFLYSFTSFAVVLVLGGGPAATTLAVEIYRAARISLDFDTASALALIETLIAVSVFGIYVLSERKSRTYSSVSYSSTQDLPKSGEKGRFNVYRFFLLGYLALAGILVLGPLVSVPLESFLSRSSRSALPSFSLRWWLQLKNSALPALLRSLILAATSASLASLLAIGAASSRWLSQTRPLAGSSLNFIMSAPLFSSGIVLGLGWMQLYGSNFSRSFVSVALVHAVVALPFAFRSISEAFSDLPSSSAEASASLGASPIWTVLQVAIPASAPAIRSAWAFSAAISLGELNAVLMLGLENWETLPLLIYRAVGAYRFGSACAAGTILALSCAAAFMLSELGKKKV